MKKPKSLQQQFEDAYRKSRNLTDDEARYVFRFSDDVYNDPFMQARWEGYQLAKEGDEKLSKQRRPMGEGGT